MGKKGIYSLKKNKIGGIIFSVVEEGEENHEYK